MSDAETLLGEQAHAFAKQYVVLVEALVMEGVPEDAARDEARMTTLYLMFKEEFDEHAMCPVTGTLCPLGNCGE